MAVELTAPWRSTDVQVFTHLQVAHEAQQGNRPPLPEHDPVATIAVADEGSLTVDAIKSYVVVGEIGEGKEAAQHYIDVGVN